MTLTVIKGAQSLAMTLPATEREVSVRAFVIPCDMIGVVHLDVADTSLGTPARQPDPVRKGERS